MKYDLSFAVNLHDDEGDSYEDCLLLFLGNGTILQFENMDEYDRFIDNMKGMRSEIKERLEDLR